MLIVKLEVSIMKNKRVCVQAKLMCWTNTTYIISVRRVYVYIVTSFSSILIYNKLAIELIVIDKSNANRWFMGFPSFFCIRSRILSVKRDCAIKIKH